MMLLHEPDAGAKREHSDGVALVLCAVAHADLFAIRTPKAAAIGRAATVLKLTSVRGWGLEGEVAVLFGGEAIGLGAEHFEGVDDLGAGVAGVDDVVDVAAGGGDVGVGEAL